ncbi:unnamed protein product [Didymodactylos carnosus]|uniref:Uncharacterized protein n=1 Tax=Didymodactylos carnosus TaxID=1234261 RepID=A0A814DSB0_9BILA|nr:unnamed protein product [Didymodactylos carnosus]CAF3736710.1 unnamed protein product [Didymodactylos carnosus]
MKLILFFIIYFHVYTINSTDLTNLTPGQAVLWLESFPVIRQTFVEIFQFGEQFEIPLQGGPIIVNRRNLFKQTIYGVVQSFVYKNEQNPRYPIIYDLCHGTIDVVRAYHNIAGTYLYTTSTESNALSIIIVSITNSVEWYKYHETGRIEQYQFNPLTVTEITNNTNLKLVFEITFHFNSESDIIILNEKVNNIINKVNVTISDDTQFPFLKTKNLKCRKHQQYVYNEIRQMVLACITDVIFTCPNQCWVYNKKLDIRVIMDSYVFASERTISFVIIP